MNRARVRQRREVDSVQQERGVGDQAEPACPHGNEDCNGPGGPGMPCARCFFGGGRDG